MRTFTEKELQGIAEVHTLKVLRQLSVVELQVLDSRTQMQAQRIHKVLREKLYGKSN